MEFPVSNTTVILTGLAIILCFGVTIWTGLYVADNYPKQIKKISDFFNPILAFLHRAGEIVFCIAAGLAILGGMSYVFGIIFWGIWTGIT